jgi:hypothetical protein
MKNNEIVITSYIAIVVILMIFSGCKDDTNQVVQSPAKKVTNTLVKSNCGEVESYNLLNIMKFQPGDDLVENKQIKCMTEALLKCNSNELSIKGETEEETYSINGKQGKDCIVSLQQSNRYIECPFQAHQIKFLTEKAEEMDEQWAASSFFWFVLRFKLELNDFEEGSTTIEFKQDDDTDENIELITCTRKYDN